MAKVTGLGGAFVRVNDPKALYAWYEANLGVSAQGGFIMFQKEDLVGYSLVSFFKKTADHFPVTQPVMLNLQVDDLDGVLAKLRAAGVNVDPKGTPPDMEELAGFRERNGKGANFV